MLDEKGKQTLFQELDRLWIQPELDRRFSSTGIPVDFKIRKCLILLPKGQKPIVQFNDEFGWLVEDPKLAGGKTLVEMQIGAPIHIYDILGIDNVLPPTVDGERVAFMYLYWENSEYHLFFDTHPNQPDYDPNDECFKFNGTAIARHLQNWLIKQVVRWAKIHQSQLRMIGMWTATPLLPYPLSKMIERIDQGNLEEARQLLVAHCDTEFISTKLVQTWQIIRVFRDRHQVFDDALFLHQNGRYHGSITSLVVQIEGVIVEWLHEILPPSSVRHRTKSRIEQFRNAMQAIPQFEYAYREAFESTVEFLQEGEEAAKPFQKFENWLDKIDPNFASRHAIAHGKYVADIYTEENSIKLFLLLDTICQFMMFYEVRVLGNNLGESTGN